MVRPVTTHGEEAQVAVIPPGFEVTVYPVTGVPLAAEDEKVTDAWPLPAVAVPMVGTLGTAAGVAAADGADATPVPMGLVAVTVNVYGEPLVSPVTVQVVAPPVAVQVLLPGDDVTLYWVMVSPPLDAGGFHDTTD